MILKIALGVAAGIFLAAGTLYATWRWRGAALDASLATWRIVFRYKWLLAAGCVVALTVFVLDEVDKASRARVEQQARQDALMQEWEAKRLSRIAACVKLFATPFVPPIREPTGTTPAAVMARTMVKMTNEDARKRHEEDAADCKDVLAMRP